MHQRQPGVDKRHAQLDDDPYVWMAARTRQPRSERCITPSSLGHGCKELGRVFNATSAPQVCGSRKSYLLPLAAGVSEPAGKGLPTGPVVFV